MANIKLIENINLLKIPKVILRYIMMKFLDLTTINNIILTVKEMNVLDNYSKNILENASKGSKWCCKNNHLDAIQWLYSIDDDIRLDIDYLFDVACENDCIDIAKWLYMIENGNINIDVYDLFSIACHSGHILGAQWIYSLPGIADQCHIMLGVHGNFLFSQSCAFGHLNAAQWLYYLDEKQGKIDIHANDESAFRQACSLGRLTVAKWLYSLGNIDIYVRDNIVFAEAHKYNHIELSQWLSSIGHISIYDIGENQHLLVPTYKFLIKYVWKWICNFF